MKINLLLLIGILLLQVGCMTPDRLQRRCARMALVCGQSTVTLVKDTTIYIDKPVTVKLPGDTVKIKETLTIHDGLVQLSPVTFRNGLVTATAWINENKLNVFAYLNQNQIIVNRKDTIYIDKYRTTETKTVTVQTKYVPKIYKTAALIVGIELLVIALWAIFLIFGPGLPGRILSLITKK